MIAANWDPPDQAVTEVYARVTLAALEPASPARYYVGYRDGAPVAASECCLARVVAGIYNVVTLGAAARKATGWPYSRRSPPAGASTRASALWGAARAASTSRSSSPLVAPLTKGSGAHTQR